MVVARRIRRERRMKETRNRVAAYLRMRSRRMDKMIADIALEFGKSQTVERSLWCRKRSDDWWNVIVDKNFKEEDWVKNFRVSKRTFLFLCEELHPFLYKKDTKLRQAIPVNKRIAVSLWRLATNADYRTIGHLFGISKASVCIIVNEFCSAVANNLAAKYIKIPNGNNLKAIVKEFRTRWGFPQCMGAIDGSHIPIKAPINFHTDYFNRKGWHSIILQGLVDSKYQFMDINIGWPGKVHDARVFGNSTLYHKGQNGSLFPASMAKEINGVNVPLLILADGAYPLLPWVMKPFPDNGALDAEKSHYNYRLSRARMVVENSFGRLKGRWRCLLKQNECSVESMSSVVATCCVLHNICEMHHDNFDEELIPLEDLKMQPTQQANDSGPPSQDSNGIREALIKYCRDNPL